MNHLLLIRGLPGSGKSTKAKQINDACERSLGDVPPYKHFEADMFHIVDGEYKFDPNNLAEAHDWCRQSTHDALKDGHDVIVSNTFTQFWEMSPYFEMAKKFGARVTVFECKGHYENIHNVPEDVLVKMSQRWEEYWV